MTCRGRSILPIALLVLGGACSGEGTSTTGASGSPPGSPSVAPTSSAPSPSPSPLVAPKGCSPDGSALEIWTVNVSWTDSKGHPFAPGEACLAAPGGPFTVTLHNDVKGVGLGSPNHNISLFTDASASDALFTGDFTLPGKSMTYHVPKLPAGTYLFHCDIHPQSMYGVLVVK
jgi:hypothetical protein